MTNLFSEADCDVQSFCLRRQQNIGQADCDCISIAKANRIFEEWLKRGTVVYGMIEQRYGKSDWICFSHNPVPTKGDTHKAILVNIEPLEVDSAEKVLADFVDYYIKPVAYSDRKDLTFDAIFERARKLLEKKGWWG